MDNTLESDQWHRRIKERTRQIKSEMFVIVVALNDPRTPWYAKLMAGLTIAYAVSPIDLIPDFIPVFGYLDDLFILPLGFYLTRILIPNAVIEDCRKKVANNIPINPKYKRIGIIIIIAVWLLVILLAVYLLYSCC